MAIDEERLQRERPRLLRQCYRFTGNIDAAEELAQEALYEAWRNAHKLRDPEASGPWLFAIARNVCARWNAARGRTPLPLDDDWDAAGDSEIEIELERAELVTLLDRALALLPAESRDVLVERYVRESPHAEIARRLGVSQDAVMKRVERGRLRLKTVLSTTLIHDAVSHGLADRLFDDWQPTDLWCPICGQRHLLGRITGNELWLICKPCHSLPVSLYATLPIPRGMHGYSAIQREASGRHYGQFARGVGDLEVPCHACSRPTRFQIETDPYDGTHYTHPLCLHCSSGGWQFASPYQLLASPDGQDFWRTEQRIRLLPERTIDIGVPALVVGFESRTSGRRLEGVLVAETLQIVSTG